jgi:hypothetical protein
LNGPDRPGSGGDRYLVNIHAEIETLKENGAGAEAELEDSDVHSPAHISAETSRRALQRRDDGCRFPGCNCTRLVDAHHVAD